MIEEGAKAPAFKAKDQDGETHTLKDSRGKHVVLYFYPKDDTPGCTKEACSFRDANDLLTEAGAVVFGVSRDDEESHKRFAEKYDLNFPLLVDDGSISEAYGTWVEKNMYGKKFMGIQRATFLIDPDGKVAKVWPKVSPENHAAEVYEALTERTTA